MAEVPELDEFDLSILEEELHNEANGDFIKQDVPLSASWMNTNMFNFSGQDIGSLTLSQNNDIEADYSDTESQAGGSSAVPSPALPVLLKSHFTFGLTDSDLVTISTKDLNKKLRDLPKSDVNEIKKRRRTLKNRKYAHSCRLKRLEERSTLQTSKSHLEEMNEVLKTQVQMEKRAKEKAIYERDLVTAQYTELVRRIRIHTRQSKKQ